MTSNTVRTLGMLLVIAASFWLVGCGDDEGAGADATGTADTVADLGTMEVAGDAAEEVAAGDVVTLDGSVGDTTADGGSEEVVPQAPWPLCEAPVGTMTLEAMAAAYDQISVDWHIQGDGLLRNVYLTEDLSQVEYWMHTPNVILWSGIYLASQALRYAVTGEQAAQDNAAVVVAGLRNLTDVTGIVGLYGRSMVDPAVPYNFDGESSASWIDSEAPGYEGWRFNHDVSKDGYDGLMLGYALALMHFDDPWIREEVTKLVAEVAEHVIGNGLQIIDHTGVVTEHGRLFHSAWDDFPGFNAMLASSWVKIAAWATGDAAIDDFYYGCLMETEDGVDCPDIEQIDMGTYLESMEEILLLFQPNYMQNYDNFDMCYQAMYPLVLLEDDADLKARLVGVTKTGMFDTDEPGFQSVAPLGNAWYSFAYVGITGDVPGDDPVLDDSIVASKCRMFEFPPLKYDRPIPAGDQEVVGYNRLDKPVAASVIPLDEMHFDNYLWRLDFFEIQEEDRPGDERLVYSPEDFLLAYWLGRYHGIIAPGE